MAHRHGTGAEQRQALRQRRQREPLQGGLESGALGRDRHRRQVEPAAGGGVGIVTTTTGTVGECAQHLAQVGLRSARAAAA